MLIPTELISTAEVLPGLKLFLCSQACLRIALSDQSKIKTPVSELHCHGSTKNRAQGAISVCRQATAVLDGVGVEMLDIS